MLIWVVTDSCRDEVEEMVASVQGLVENVEVELMDTCEISFELDGNNEFRLWKEGREISVLPDVVWPIMMEEHGTVEPFTRELESMGVYSFASLNAKNDAKDKLRTYQRIGQIEGIPIIRTIAFRGDVSEDFLIDRFSLPMVVKPEYGYGGAGVELLHNREELTAYLAEAKKSEEYYLAEEFISSSKGRDLRVVCLYGKVLFGALRHNDDPNEFRSNIKTGGSGELYPMTQEQTELAEKVAMGSGLDFCGLDFLFGPDGLILDEVNSAPGFGHNFNMFAPMVFDAIRKHLKDMGKTID